MLAACPHSCENSPRDLICPRPPYPASRSRTLSPTPSQSPSRTSFVLSPRPSSGKAPWPSSMAISRPGAPSSSTPAASPSLLRHTGRAVVFDSLEDLAGRIDLPDLDVAPDDILVLRNAGPQGGPGMPEAGYLPIPLRLARQGVKDMVRISDARMSGTAFGTIVLHITPESAVGGPLAIVETGDRISLDVEARRIDLLIDESELVARLAARQAATPSSVPRVVPTRGYARLFEDHILQADEGCDFDFLRR